MFEEKTSNMSEQTFFPNEDAIYIPPVQEPVYNFIKKIWYSFVNKMVSISLRDGDYCFDHALFEVIDGDCIKIAAVSSQIRLDDIAKRKIPREFDDFIFAVEPYPLNNKNSYSSNLLRNAIWKVSHGNNPPMEVINLRKDKRIHPRIKDLLTDTMNYAVTVPLFLKGSPVGILWGVWKDPLTKKEKDLLFPQLSSFSNGISTIISLEFERGDFDFINIRKTIEKIDTSSIILNLLYTKHEGQNMPLRTIFGKSIKYNKNFRLDANYIVPTSRGYSISLKRFMPEEINNTDITLLMIPGFFCKRTIMDIYAREMCFRYGYKVISLDLRGRSKYTLPDEKMYDGWSIDDFINEDFPAAINWIAEHYPNDRIVVCGHSMGAMIPRFYSVAYDKIKNITRKVNLPDPDTHIAGIVSIASPDYIDVKAQIPGFRLLIKGIKRITKIRPIRKYAAPMVDKFLSNSFSAIMPTINLQKYLTYFNNINRSMRLLAFNINANFLTLQNFLGYRQITPPEMYLFMEDMICEESTQVMIQLLRSQLLYDAVLSYDGKINYTRELKNFRLPVFCVCGTLDTVAPPATIEHGFRNFLSRNKVLKRYDQGHLGIMIHPETVRDFARETSVWISSLPK